MINKSIICKFFKDFTNHRIKKKKGGSFSWQTSNTGTSDETFQQSGEINSWRHLLKRSSNTYESWGSKFFKTTTRIQSGPDAFDKSRLFVIFLTRISVLRIVLIKNCALSDAEGNISGTFIRCGISDLALLWFNQY